MPPTRASPKATLSAKSNRPTTVDFRINDRDASVGREQDSRLAMDGRSIDKKLGTRSADSGPKKSWPALGVCAK